MSLVIDASLTMTWYFDDETTPTTEELLDRVVDAGALVPSVWRLEVANAFQTAIRRKRIDALYRDASLAERFALTIYDAAYLELAQRRSLPLATLDQELRTAALALGTPLLGAAA